MTQSTLLGFLSAPQFTGPEGRELLAMLEAYLARHGANDTIRWTKDRPEGAAIGMYYIRAADLTEEDPA